jgi:membrane-associated phospholipid phosphatase
MCKSAPYTIIVVALVLAVFTRNPWAIAFFIGIVVSQMVNYVCKKMSETICMGSPICERPHIPSGGCGNFDQHPDHSEDTSFGMPSGHTQALTLTATFASLYIYTQTRWSIWSRHLTVLVVWSIALIVAESRIQLGCHNEAQVAVGLLLGVMIASLTYITTLRVLK